MTMIIDPNSIDVNTITQNLIDFIETSPDGESWKDYSTNSSSGRIFIALIAGLGAFLGYNTVIGRREAFIRFAKQLSSIIGIAQFNNYSSYRGKNPVYTIDFVSNQNSLLTTYTVVGQYGVYDLIYVGSNIPLILDNSYSLDITLGFVKNESHTISTTNPSIFRYYSSNVTEEFRLLLNDNVVPTSTQVLDLVNDKYFTLTNPMGAIDVSYLNTGDYTYAINDILKLEYVSRVDEEIVLVSKDVILDVGTLSDISLLTEAEDQETATSIVVNSPLQREAGSVIKSRGDFESFFRRLDSTIINTNGHDLSPSVIQLTYIKDDLSTFTDCEKDEFISELNKYRAFGVQPLDSIIDSIKNNVTLPITITIDAEYTGVYNLGTDIRNILSGYELLTEESLDLKIIEKQITQLAYVVIARPTVYTENVDPLFVNTTTDEITVAKNYETGSPLFFSTTGILPTPLIAGTRYYAINVNATKIRLAPTYTDALNDTNYINITDDGTSEFTIYPPTICSWNEFFKFTENITTLTNV